jgi:hypothetical protein
MSTVEREAAEAAKALDEYASNAARYKWEGHDSKEAANIIAEAIYTATAEIVRALERERVVLRGIGDEML